MSIISKEFLISRIDQSKIKPTDFKFNDGVWRFLLNDKVGIILSCLNELSYIINFALPFLVGGYVSTQNYYYLIVVIALLFLDSMVFLTQGHRRQVLQQIKILSLVSNGQKVLMNLDPLKIANLSTGEAVKQIERASSSVEIVLKSLVKNFFRLSVTLIMLLVSAFYANIGIGIGLLAWLVFNFCCSYWITSFCNSNIRPDLNKAQNKEKSRMIENITQLTYIKSVYFTDVKLDSAIEVSTTSNRLSFVYWQSWRILISLFYFVSIALMICLIVYTVNTLNWNTALLSGLVFNIIVQQINSYEYGLMVLDFQKAFRDLQEYFIFMSDLEKDIQK